MPDKVGFAVQTALIIEHVTFAAWGKTLVRDKEVSM
jgi:hypothetical protein